MVSPVSLLEGHYRTSCPMCGTMMDYTEEDVFIRIYTNEKGERVYTDAIKCCVCPTHILLRPPKTEVEDQKGEN